MANQTNADQVSAVEKINMAQDLLAMVLNKGEIINCLASVLTKEIIETVKKEHAEEVLENVINIMRLSFKANLERHSHQKTIKVGTLVAEYIAQYPVDGEHDIDQKTRIVANQILSLHMQLKMNSTPKAMEKATELFIKDCKSMLKVGEQIGAKELERFEKTKTAESKKRKLLADKVAKLTSELGKVAKEIEAGEQFSQPLKDFAKELLLMDDTTKEIMVEGTLITKVTMRDTKNLEKVANALERMNEEYSQKKET